MLALRRAAGMAAVAAATRPLEMRRLTAPASAPNAQPDRRG